MIQALRAAVVILCMHRRVRAAAAALCVVCLGGCSHDQPAASGRPGTRPAAPPATRGTPARPRETAVIRAWADTLRAGRVAAAASYFTVPAVAANGGPAINLLTRRDVRLFNASLPCGAVLLSTRRISRYTVATFRLTDRPGGGCGPGAGQKAAAAFVFSRGKIAEWRRVPLPPGPAPRKPSRRSPSPQV